MGIIVIGFIILLAGLIVRKQPSPAQKFGGRIQILGGAVLIVGLFTASLRQIGAGEVGVQSLFGKVQEGTLESGLHLVNPLVAVSKFDIKTQSYTMSGVHGEGDKEGDDAIRVLSNDGLQLTLDLTVLYRVVADQTPTLLKRIGPDYKDNIVRPITRTRIRDNAVYYTAIDLYSVKRAEFQERIFKTIEKDFQSRGLLLEQLLIRNIELPLSVRKSIESKIQAEQDAQKMQFVLQKEKQEADRKRIEAQGIADYQKIVSLELNDKLLQYEAIKANKEIALSPNAKVIIMGNKANTPIMISDR